MNCYFTVTEEEIHNGILNSSDPRAQSLCYIRHIEDIKVNLSYSKAGLYIDVQRPGKQDEEAQQLLDTLKRKRLLQVSGIWYQLVRIEFNVIVYSWPHKLQ